MNTTNTNCEKCGAIMPSQMKECKFCDVKKAGSALKSLFGIFVDDAKNLAAKVKKVRVKTHTEDDNTKK